MITANGHSNGGPGRAILSLDGGGPRGVSQLRILLEMIHIMDYDTGHTNDRTLTLPCECFDLIGGSGTGGFIAILLVTFGLSAADALEVFMEFSEEVLDESIQITVEMRTRKMRKAIDALLKKHGFPLDARLSSPNECDRGCKLVVPVMHAQNLGKSIHLRNHEVSSSVMLDISIKDAIMATCASPSLFSAVRVQESSSNRDFVSADGGLCNPTREIIKAACEAFGEDGSVACVLSLGTGNQGVVISSGKLNGMGASNGVDTSMEQQNMFRRIAEDCERVARELDDQMGDTGVYIRFSVDQGMQRSLIQNVGFSSNNEGAQLAVITHTLAYLGQPKVGRDINICVDALKVRRPTLTWRELHRFSGEHVVTRSLPVSVSHFVRREGPWKQMQDIFFCKEGKIRLDHQIIMVISGMGGSGKTQLALKFAREYQELFASVIFVDASSVERMKDDILRHVQSTNPKYNRTNFERALEILGEPLPKDGPEKSEDNVPSTPKVPWLIIYDNCDDEALQLSSYLPRCDYGCILVTTRLHSLKQLQPESALELGNMSSSEAVETLLSCSGRLRQYPRGNLTTKKDDQATMEEIALKLGYLPLALVQAGSHVYESAESWAEYLRNLETNMNRLMEKPPKSQRDGNNMSTFSAFHSTYVRLPSHIQKIIPLLSFFHSRPLPLEAIEIAAKDGFCKEYYDYQIPRKPIHRKCIALLNQTFCQSGTLDPFTFAEAITTLQNYSLILVIRSHGLRLIYMHPLIQAWARTLLVHGYSKREYEYATIRILAAGACQDSGIIDHFLVKHLIRAKMDWRRLHANDKAAFAIMLHRTKQYSTSLKLKHSVWEDIHTVQKSSIEIPKVVQLRALIEYAETYKRLGQYLEAKRLYEKVYKESMREFGRLHSHTINAMNNLIIVFSKYGEIDGARAWLEHLERTYNSLLSDPAFGPGHDTTLSTQAGLALVYYRLNLFKDAEKLQLSVVEYRQKNLGEEHKETIDAHETIGRIYAAQQRPNDAEILQQKVLKWRKEHRGPDHKETVKARTLLATTLLQKQSYKEAKDLYTEALQSQARVMGATHIKTAQTTMNLAWTLYYMGKFKKAERLAKEGQDVIKEVLGKDHEMYHRAVTLIKKIRRI